MRPPPTRRGTRRLPASRAGRRRPMRLPPLLRSTHAPPPSPAPRDQAPRSAALAGLARRRFRCPCTPSIRGGADITFDVGGRAFHHWLGASSSSSAPLLAAAARTRAPLLPAQTRKKAPASLLLRLARREGASSCGGRSGIGLRPGATTPRVGCSGARRSSRSGDDFHGERGGNARGGHLDSIPCVGWGGGWLERAGHVSSSSSSARWRQQWREVGGTIPVGW